MSDRFSYVRYDDLATSTQAHLRSAFEHVEALVAQLTPGRAQSLVYTKLEEAYMWIGKAVRDDQIQRTGVVAEQPERTDG